MNIAARIEIVDLDSGKIIQDGRIFKPVRVEDHSIHDEYDFHVKFAMVKEERNDILQKRLEDYPWEKEESDG